MNSIASLFLSIVNSILSIFQRKQEAKIEEKKEAQSEDNVKRAEVIKDVKLKDENEVLIKNIQEAKTEDEKQKMTKHG